MTSVVKFLPLTQHAHNHVSAEFLVEELTDEVQVGNEGGLEDNRDVAGVEELNGVGRSATPDFLILDRQVDLEALEVDNNQEDKDGGQETIDVG